MKFSRTLGYAVQSLVHLAEQDGMRPVSCRELAETGQMPKRFLLQILRSLVTHGILRSTRGVEGGYMLARAPGEISLLEVVEAIDGPVRLELAQVEMERPEAREALAALSSDVRHELRSVSLAHLARRRVPSLASGRALGLAGLSDEVGTDRSANNGTSSHLTYAG